MLSAALEALSDSDASADLSPQNAFHLLMVF